MESFSLSGIVRAHPEFTAERYINYLSDQDALDYAKHLDAGFRKFGSIVASQPIWDLEKYHGIPMNSDLGRLRELLGPERVWLGPIVSKGSYRPIEQKNGQIFADIYVQCTEEEMDSLLQSGTVPTEILIAA